MNDERFPKAPLLQIRWFGWRSMFGPRARWVLGVRMANAYGLFIGPIEICWRMPWHRNAVYSAGFDAGYEAASGSGDNIAGLREAYRLSDERRAEYENALQVIHETLDPGEPFYSWQRVYQNAVRMRERLLNIGNGCN